MNKANITRLLVITLLILLFLPVLKQSWDDTQNNGAVDLRCRVVGARLLTNGQDPYFYKWKPADGEYFLDPNDQFTRRVNGNVSTPGMLWLLSPLYSLNYNTIHILWLIFQYLALAACFALLLQQLPRQYRLMPLALVSLGLFTSGNWLMHVERGQIYIFYALLFSLIWWLYQKGSRFSIFFSGFLTAVFIFLRPFALIICAGMLFTRSRQWFAGTVTGMLTCLILFVSPAPSAWKQYFAAMKEYQHITLTKETVITGTEKPVIPAIIEGSAVLQNHSHFQTFALPSFYIYANRLHIPYTPAISIMLLGLTTLALCIAFYFRQRAELISTSHIFLLCWLLYWSAECLMISPRGPYNFVQWIFPLLLVLRTRSFQPAFVIAIASGLILQHSLLFSHALIAATGELILAATVLFAIFTKEPTTIPKWVKPHPPSPDHR
ncbi:MAG TPA: glycosyltransferase family 87 protein [Pseudobacter sp.]|nr:glycosyltransferase family 87 protein [Pseudobacter sp.]